MNVDTIEINSEDLKELIEVAKKEFPLESAILLLGKLKDKKAVVSKLVKPKYSQRNEKSFTIEPIFLYEVLTRADDEGLELVAIFHSHPSKPEPSAKDLEFMKLNPIVWLILSMPSQQLGAFILKNDKVKVVKIKVV